MKPTLKIAAAHLVCTAAVLAVAELALPNPVLRDAAVLVVSGLAFFRLIGGELGRRDRTEQILRIQATYDALTGLVNRAHFEQTLERASAKASRGGPRFGVAYIDLNDFKQVNDRHGHHMGDMLLQDVAQRICSVVRAGDCAARFGGDEFVVLVDDPSETAVYRLAERLRLAFAAPFVTHDLNLTITVSIGVAYHPGQGTRTIDVLQAADEAMYVAKRSRQGRAVTAFSSAA